MSRKPLGIDFPVNGGCWYCHTKDAGTVFCHEFDTNVHPGCVRDALAKDPNNPEARIIAAEVLGEEVLCTPPK